MKTTLNSTVTVARPLVGRPLSSSDLELVQGGARIGTGMSTATGGGPPSDTDSTDHGGPLVPES